MGKSDGWHGWDWLQELNNLYTKVNITREVNTVTKTEQVIFTEQGSNHTHQLVMKRSVLIEIY